MAVIKDALSSLPAKPALVIAPLLVVVVLSLYYRDQYNKCVEIRQTRAELTDYLLALDAPARFRLEDFTDFPWTRVRIAASVAPGTISDTCPMDWNWASGERDALIASGGLAAMIFGHDGRIVRYLELRADEVQFRGAEGNLTPEEAVFDVERKSSDGGYVLKMQK